MNFVVISAALSSMNTNIYLCSRMLFSLSRGSYAPKYLGKLSGNGTPVGAILTSGACILLAASASMITPLAYNYLFGIAIFGAIIVWMTILVSHLSFRRRHDVSKDRKSVVSGKRVSVRVDLGGRRIIKKKT